MATNANWVFEQAMHLMDEGNENTGETNTGENRDYRHRTLPILNVLRVECFPCSDTCAVTEAGKRPICPEIPDFDTPIGLDDGICQGVLPYGLAAHLLADENPALASFFQQRYELLLKQAGRSRFGQSEEIVDLYGGIEHGEFSCW